MAHQNSGSKNISPKIYTALVSFLIKGGLFAIVLIIILGISMRYYLKGKKVTPLATLPYPTSTLIPSPITREMPGKMVTDATGEWKTLTNTKYGFQVTFPARGLLFDYGNRISTESACGSHIQVVNSYPSSNNAMEISRIHLEGFFGIFINEISPTKTLNEYITETEKIYNMNNSSENSSFHSFKELYTFTPLSESNADDAVIVKKNASSGYGDNVPFSSTMALYKKGGRIYSLSTGQQLINCYAPLKGVKWDIPRSFKLL